MFGPSLFVLNRSDNTYIQYSDGSYYYYNSNTSGGYCFAKKNGSGYYSGPKARHYTKPSGERTYYTPHQTDYRYKK